MARHSNGWIKLYRRALESDLGENAYLWCIWTSLLSWATWVEQKRLIDGEQRILPPGTVVFGITELAVRWSCSKSTVSKWLRHLALSERITLEVRTRGCIATICNWDEYQTELSTGRTNCEQSPNEVRTLSEPYEEEKKRRRKNNTPLPPKGLQAIWNENCGGLPKAETLNRDRERQAKARAQENADSAYWVRIVEAIAANPFCRGENDRGWVATFDYLLRPKTHVQISERLKAGPIKDSKTLGDEMLRAYELEKAAAETQARKDGIIA